MVFVGAPGGTGNLSGRSPGPPTRNYAPVTKVNDSETYIIHIQVPDCVVVFVFASLSAVA